MKRIVAALVFCVTLAGVCAAQKKGTAPEAEALVKKAVAFLKANGKEKALEAITDPKGKFVSGDLYVFVYDLNGKCLAHGGNAKMVGKDLIDLRDADGKAFVQERIAIVKEKGKGWQNYKWTNPVTRLIENKTAYLELVDGVIVGCGAYQ